MMPPRCEPPRRIEGNRDFANAVPPPLPALFQVQPADTQARKLLPTVLVACKSSKSAAKSLANSGKQTVWAILQQARASDSTDGWPLFERCSVLERCPGFAQRCVFQQRGQGRIYCSVKSLGHSSLRLSTAGRTPMLTIGPTDEGIGLFVIDELLRLGIEG